MAIKKASPVREFILPETLDDAPEAERGVYMVRMATTGQRRLLGSVVSEEGWNGIATFQARQAYYTYGGSTIRWSDGTLVFPEPIDLTGTVRRADEIEHMKQWTRAWDELPAPVTDWIMDRVYEVNVDWDPDRANPT